jgi:hypothetical protein
MGTLVYVGYLDKYEYFEFDIRGFGQWLRALGPGALTALDGNSRAKHAAVHQKPPFPRFVSPFHAAQPDGPLRHPRLLVAPYSPL